MSTKTEVIEEQAVSTPIETDTMEEIVNKVRRDSQHDARTYLKESEVPHGGE